MRIGIVSPYDFDVPGGVQVHVLQMADTLRLQGHHVGVIGPGRVTDVPGVTCTGASFAVPYNGSVARLGYGPRVEYRVKSWLAENRFDIVHVHEPATPSVSLIALRQANVPVVGTFHSAQVHSRAMRAAYPMLRPWMEKLAVRIAVSEEARRTAVEHLGGDALVIPNGIDVAAFRDAPSVAHWQGQRHGALAPTIAFLGRLDEQRKGLHVLAAASHRIRKTMPHARFLIAGRGPETSRANFAAGSVEFLGEISDADKAGLLASADIFVAPQTGGESFGIVLVEAISAGCPVVASDLAAFKAVLRNGRDGTLFSSGSPDALAAAVQSLLSDLAGQQRRTEMAQLDAHRFDWSKVGAKVCGVYAAALGVNNFSVPVPIAATGAVATISKGVSP